MVRPICKDVFTLALKSKDATKEDIETARDLLDTLAAHRGECVGMAANMIGVSKRIIAVGIGPMNIAMLNPVITASSDPYEAEEGCLSLSGIRKTIRYQSITVEYRDMEFRKQKQSFSGYSAQIIQHEVDHCNGVLI